MTEFRTRTLHYLRELDPAEWMTIPQMAVKLGIKTIEAGQIIDLLGLRWKGPHNRYSNKEPTLKAYDTGCVVELDDNDYQRMWRWNCNRVLKMFSEL